MGVLHIDICSRDVSGHFGTGLSFISAVVNFLGPFQNHIRFEKKAQKRSILIDFGRFWPILADYGLPRPRIAPKIIVGMELSYFECFLTSKDVYWRSNSSFLFKVSRDLSVS